MLKRRTVVGLLPVCLLLVASLFLPACFNSTKDKPSQTELTLDEYLKTSNEEWFLTGKKEYTVQAMMVSQELSFHNDLEDVDYTVDDDGVTVVLRGSAGEMWASELSSVQSTYTKPDGSEIRKEDFAEKDAYIDIVAKPAPDSCYAMFVPVDQRVLVETSWGDELHANHPDVEHGDGDYLVCRVGADGEPDLSDVWVVNGTLFSTRYDTSHLDDGASQ
ncbi:MAG: hypothetical protein IKE22_13530 [Atopobiaceae bacterium]|nr:hypothetical protein [Atopobiaceae bacterium]